MGEVGLELECEEAMWGRGVRVGVWEAMWRRGC